jgi:hypothetical protein
MDYSDGSGTIPSLIMQLLGEFISSVETLLRIWLKLNLWVDHYFFGENTRQIERRNHWAEAVQARCECLSHTLKLKKDDPNDFNSDAKMGLEDPKKSCGTFS